MQWMCNKYHNCASWGPLSNEHYIQLREESKLACKGGFASEMLEYKHYTLIIVYS